MTRPATSACPASTSAVMISPVENVPPSFRVSSAATVTPQFHIASRTILALEAPPQTRSGTGGKGSRLYEVNIWMWRYGRDHPRMLSITEAKRRIRRERISESRTRAGEIRKRRSEAAAVAGAAEGGGGPGAQ